jgi:hypothetical protein
MSRYLLQSASSGKFLCPCPQGGEPIWVASLQQAGGGVVSDLETVHQLSEDHHDFENRLVLIDLDRLGTVNDYPVDAVL